MALVDCEYGANVYLLFEELIRGHAAATPLGGSPDQQRTNNRPAPPRRTRREPCFWDPHDQGVRVAELTGLLAPPDVLALPFGDRDPVAGCRGWSSVGPHSDAEGEVVPEEAPPRPVALPSLAPVAMAAGALDQLDAASFGVSRAARWLVPVSAGALVLGAFVATGIGQLEPGVAASWIAAPAPSPAPEGSTCPASPGPCGASTAELESDLLEQAQWAASELLDGPAMAPIEPTRAQRAPSPDGEAVDRLERPKPVRGPRAAADVAPPRGSRSAQAWSAAARLGRTSGRHLGRHPSGESAMLEAPSATFDAQAARAALLGATGAARGCATAGAGTQRVPVSVTFAPSGRATVAQVGGALSGTATGSCVARLFRQVSVPAFSGPPVTVSKTLLVP